MTSSTSGSMANRRFGSHERPEPADIASRISWFGTRSSSRSMRAPVVCLALGEGLVWDYPSMTTTAVIPSAGRPAFHPRTGERSLGDRLSESADRCPEKGNPPMTSWSQLATEMPSQKRSLLRRLTQFVFRRKKTRPMFILTEISSSGQIRIGTSLEMTQPMLAIVKTQRA